MRVLVTGAGGFVGSRVMRMLAGQYELYPLPKGMAAGDPDAVLREVARVQPDMILHTAAISDTGYCQQHPEESYRSNVVLPLALAKTGVRLVAFSSDQVYTGLGGSTPFAEDAPLQPTNVYGQHKREMEQRVLDAAPNAVLLRATWMYDFAGDGLPLRGNLPLNLLRAAQAGEELGFSARDFRGITWVRDAVQNLPAAMQLPGGVYNFGCENPLDMWQTAQEFGKILNVAPKLMRQDWQRCLAMDTAKAQRGGVVFADTVQAFRQCVEQCRHR